MYFTKNCAKYLFGMQTDSSRVITRGRHKVYRNTMASSSAEVAKETGDLKQKVLLEEEAVMAKLCSKLVSNNIYILKTTFKGHFMFLIPVWMLDVKF